MKFRPILYQTEMVQAIEAGTKSMTRRTKGLEKLTNHYFQSLVHHATGKFTFVENGNYSPKESDVIVINCPFGQVGDILWVRETTYNEGDFVEPPIYIYRANNPNWQMVSGGKWTPSIFMPKSASRFFLRITDISVERLYDISEQDAIGEGIDKYYNVNSEGNEKLNGWRYFDYRKATRDILSPKQSFFSLWESINGKQSLSDNPFVWVIKFERMECKYNSEINNFELIE